jgi:hypothetical protein
MVGLRNVNTRRACVCALSQRHSLPTPFPFTRYSSTETYSPGEGKRVSSKEAIQLGRSGLRALVKYESPPFFFFPFIPLLCNNANYFGANNATKRQSTPIRKIIIPENLMLNKYNPDSIYGPNSPKITRAIALSLRLNWLAKR